MTAPDRPSRAAGILLATSCAACSGLAVAFGKVALEDLTPVAFSFWLFVCSLPPSAAVAGLTGGLIPPGRISRRGWALVTLHAVLIFGSLWAFWTGLTTLDPTVSVFLSRVEILVAVGFGIWLFGERLGLLAGLGAAATIVGVVVMGLPAAGSGEGMFETIGPGAIWILAHAVLVGVAEVVAKVAVRHVAPAAVTFWRNVMLTVAFGIAAASMGRLSLPAVDVLLPTAAAAVCGPTLGRFLFLLALRRLEISWVTLVTQSTPLFTAAGAFVLVGRLPTTLQFLGGGIVITGCVLVSRDGRGNPVPG